ncbi:unnamed protein product [Arabidopsis lyrata]|uniref:ferredoxin-dependent glutamate synthase, chloroplastic isoform X2 n=1 Tax=Arabidopsis lyrata subsp. lyrata TaxID=81972 RepID=UPI000A29E281|nr:ferredoxin-dependent glutamate synthase, chloroplastic isoform X2 [Arabidopsis lyrata subsp. lyrata]XP_020878057.1 ferredoxin-dependent glutamate synthase, chloroplastic isoform X2 [Arabidopsis lyrata subsp. lyrata]CAH8271070.1 unnamed protein product [Arabidopsis lyrata]|eukprot:XP_020878056.1 ferredoxin-dependent glutamate synthase, chloroplastic isoform X2 [Arabidopsis lyrata subsp. lyrata]
MKALPLGMLYRLVMVYPRKATTLIENGLRERVILRVDGGLKSGVDVLMATAMGADEYGFGFLAMIATGCLMARICHTNNCLVDVASQVDSLDPVKFPCLLVHILLSF